MGSEMSNLSTVSADVAFKEKETNTSVSSAYKQPKGTALGSLRLGSKRRVSENDKNIRNNDACNSMNSLVSSLTLPSTTWYIRPTTTFARPIFCSMEMISFDKENECFHRTEIAYPYVVDEISCCHSTKKSSFKINNKKENNKNTVETSTIHGRRLAKRLEIRTAAVNNVYKHSLIWQ
jgi:hypothetical protein